MAARVRSTLIGLAATTLALLGGWFVWARSAPAPLAPGGFLEEAASTAVRPPPTAAEIARFVPGGRERFFFPLPYGTEAYRLTIGEDCADEDCVQQEGYSFHRNINAQSGQPVVRVFVSLFGAGGPTLITVDKATGAVTKVGPIFRSGPLANSRAVGWFWSATDPDLLYAYSDDSKLIGKNVATGSETTVFDLASPGAMAAHGLGAKVKVWTAFASNDGMSWAMTVKRSVDPWDDLGCAIHHVPTQAWHFIPGVGDCFVDKSGAFWLKTFLGGNSGNDIQKGTVNPWSAGEVLADPQGAPGHLDLGWGFMIGEDNWAKQGQTLRLWDLSQAFSAPGQGRPVHTMVSWLPDSYTQPTWSTSEPATLETVGRQAACSTSTSGGRLEAPVPREREVVCFPLDGSGRMLVVAPIMTDMAAKGGRIPYYRAPKGNLDPASEYYFWITNLGGDRLDAFLVRVPLHLLRQ